MKHVALVAALGLGLLTACSPAPQLPPGVTAKVYQTRSDVAAGMIEIQVHNDSPSDLEVVAATVDSPVLASAAHAARGAVIPEGATIDLKSPLPEAVCPPPSEPPQPTVSITAVVGGRPVSGDVPAVDSLGQLSRIADTACRQREVESAVSIVAPGQVRGDGRPLVLRYQVTPGPTPRRVEFIATGPTTLLTPADQRGSPIRAQRVGTTVAPDSPRQVIDLRYSPARCDAHAVADDKQGTLLPMTVRIDGRPSTMTVPVSQELRAQIHAAVTHACGLS